jgi:Flp pilus assembly protein TadG
MGSTSRTRLSKIAGRGTQSGQALVEFAIVALMMIVLAFGLIDFGRAIYQKQVMTNLTREGSNLAARNTPLTDAATAVIQGSAPLDLSTSGRVILTSVQNNSGTCRLMEQVSVGGITASSRMGIKKNDKVTAIPCSNSADSLPQPGQTAYVTEVYYQYQPLTPVGKIISAVLPSPLYDVAYF